MGSVTPSPTSAQELAETPQADAIHRKWESLYLEQGGTLSPQQRDAAFTEAMEALRDTEHLLALERSARDDNIEAFGKLEQALRSRVLDAKCPHVVTTDEGTSYCKLAESQGSRVLEIPEGWTLMPEAPTPEIIEAMRIAWCRHNYGEPYSKEIPDIYRAAHAAAKGAKP